MPKLRQSTEPCTLLNPMMKINGMNSCLPGPVHHPFLAAGS